MSELPLLYHVSPMRFEQPEIDKCLEFLLTRGKSINKSVNGAMGLWVSPFPGACEAFGPECATLQLNSSARMMGMPIRHLYTLYRSIRDDLSYEEQVLAHYRYGRVLAELADVLCIVDRYNHFGEVVILNTNVINNWQWQDNFDFSKNYPSASLDDFYVERVPSWFFDKSGKIIEDVDFPLEQY